MKLIIGTESKIKLAAVEKVLQQVLGSENFICEGMEADSGVPATPWNEETLTGSENRAKNCYKKNPEADYWVGLESGLVDRYGAVFEEAWACVVNKNGDKYFGFSSGLKVPDYVLQQMDELGQEHNYVMGKLRKNPDGPKDTWGDYSAGMILRTVSLEESLRNALIQIFAPKESYYHLK